MLYLAQQGDANDWPAEHRDGQSLDFLVLAARVEGLSPGVYWYRALNHALLPSRAGLSAAETLELFVQEQFASAPLVIWIAGDLAGACARHGAFGLRQLLLRAGAAGNRLWMAALGIGLAGCLVAGIIPGAARRLLGLDGYRHASLLALSIGVEDKYLSRPLFRGDFSPGLSLPRE
jgi:nitroreductase